MPTVKVGYDYNPSNINAIEALLSAPRLSTYLRASEGENKEQALNLYIWNARVSTSLHWPLQVVELSLRNAIDLQMSEKFGNFWIDPNNAPLNSGAIRKIKEGKEQISRSGKTVTKDRVVASLSFGFWTTMLGNGGHEVDYHMSFGHQHYTKPLRNHLTTIIERKFRKHLLT